MGLQSGMRDYLLTIVIVAVVVLGLSFLHTLLLSFAKQLGVATLDITTAFDLTFRITIFVTLIPIGILVFIISVGINPIGQIGYDFVNIFISILNDIVQGLGWSIPLQIWTHVETGTWLPDFATLVDTAIKMLLGTTV